MFERFIGIDWSGSGRCGASNSGLAIAEGGSEGPPPARPTSRVSRIAVTDWLVAQLGPDTPRTVVGLDFAFGFPVGAHKLMYGTSCWNDFALSVSGDLSCDGRQSSGTPARDLAYKINEKFEGAGPFRDNETRSDFRFYVEHGVPYFRMTENCVPQAISPWYIGSGATVALSTLTGIAALGRLLKKRAEGVCRFRVFPFEEIDPRSHLIVEVYPAIWADPRRDEGKNEHVRDAKRIVRGLRGLTERDLQLPAPDLTPWAVCPRCRVREEGWIVGVGRS